MDEGQPNRGGDYLGRGHPRGGGQAGGAQPYCYTFPCRPEGESSDAVITSVKKMYCDLKQHYWWWKMKKVIVGHVSRCLNCHQVKYERQNPGGLTQRLVIQEWNWERITMDFVIGLPQTLKRFDAILGHCRYVGHVRAFYSDDDFFYFREVGPDLFERLFVCTIALYEVYMVGGDILLLVSLSPVRLGYWTLFGQRKEGRRGMRTRRFMMWLYGGRDDTFESFFYEGRDENWEESQVGSRFISPFEVLERVKEVAYKFALTPSLFGVHPVFHVSMLRKYNEDNSNVVDFNTMQINENLTYIEEVIAIIDRQVRMLRSMKVSSVKVLWKGQPSKEAI
nr:uncharacterized protein LOC104093960 [Nicotiana tomentosiformis]